MRKCLSLFTVIILAFSYACGTVGSEGSQGQGGDETVQFDPMNPANPVDPNNPGDNGNDGPEIAEETPCQGMPGGCLEISKLKGVNLQFVQNQAELKAAHEAYVQELKSSGAYPDANVEEVAQQWKDTVGNLPINSLHLNRANLNKFLQFVRISREPYTGILLDMAGQSNVTAQAMTNYYIDPPKVDNLETIAKFVELERYQLAPIKTAILKTAKIYGVHITDLDDAFDQLAGPFAGEVTDTIADNIDAMNYVTQYNKSTMIGLNLKIFGELHALLHEASFKIEGKNEYVSFVEFLLLDSDGFAPDGEYLHRHRLYGAHDTASLSFME